MTLSRYASDTTKEEWAVIAPYMPAEPARGRPRKTALRAVVQYYFYRWRDDAT
jgi:transposase